MRIGVKPGQWGWSFADLRASWRAAEEAGLDYLACSDHVSAGPSGSAAWDAPTLLAAMAAVTDRVTLSVRVIDVTLRNPLLLAGQLTVAQAASGGRLDVGLGTGNRGLAPLHHGAAGIEFPRLADRSDQLERCCRLLPALWRGERVTDAPSGLRDACLGPTGITPPRLTVAASGPRTMRSAARHADAWIAVCDDPVAYERLARQLDAACRAVGRDRALSREVQIPLDVDELATARALLGRFAAAGADSAVISLPAGGPAMVRRVAEAVV